MKFVDPCTCTFLVYQFNESSNNNNNSTTFTETKDQIVFKNVDRFLIKCYYCDNEDYYNEDYYFEGINTNEVCIIINIKN